MSDALTLNNAAANAKPLHGKGHWQSIIIKPTDWRTIANPPAILTGATAPILFTEATTASIAENMTVRVSSGVAASAVLACAGISVPMQASLAKVSGKNTLAGLRVCMDITDAATADTAEAGLALTLTPQLLGQRIDASPATLTPVYKRIINRDTGATVTTISNTAADWDTIWTTYKSSYDAGVRHIWVWDYSKILNSDSVGILPGDQLILSLSGVGGATTYTQNKDLRSCWVEVMCNIGNTYHWLR